MPRSREASIPRTESSGAVKQTPERRRSIATLRGGLHKNYRSATDLSRSAELSLPSSTTKGRPSSARPSSARDANRRMSTTLPTGTDASDLRGRTMDSSRGRTKDKDSADAARQRRSRSIGAPEMRRQLNKTISSPQFTPNKAKDNNILFIKRDGAGKHKVSPVLNGNNNNDSSKRPNTLNSTRMNMSPNRILPNKMKGFPRSQSLDTSSPVSPSEQNGKAVFTLGPQYDDLPDPLADVEANKRMELLFEEYRRIELGLPVEWPEPEQVPEAPTEKDSNANPKTVTKNLRVDAKAMSKIHSSPVVNNVSRATPQRKLSTGSKTHSRTNSAGKVTTNSAGWRKERTPSPCPFDNNLSSGRSTPNGYHSNGRMTSTSSDVSLDMMSLSSASGGHTPRGRYGSTSSEASDVSQRQVSGRSTPRSSVSTPRSTPVPRSKTPTPHGSPGSQRKMSIPSSVTPQGSPTPQRKIPSPRSRSSTLQNSRSSSSSPVPAESLGVESNIPVSRSRSPSPRGSPRSPRLARKHSASRSNSPSPRASPIPRRTIPTSRSNSPSPHQSPRRGQTSQQSPKPRRKASGLAAPAVSSTQTKANIPTVTRSSWGNAPWKSSSTPTSSSISLTSSTDASRETSPEKETPEKSPSFVSKTAFSLSPPAVTTNTPKGNATKPPKPEFKLAKTKTVSTKADTPKPKRIEPKTPNSTSVNKTSEHTGDIGDTSGIIKKEMSVQITPITYTPGEPTPTKDSVKPPNKVAVSYDGAWDDVQSGPPVAAVQPQIKKPVQRQQSQKKLSLDHKNMVPAAKVVPEAKSPTRRVGVSYPRSQSAVRSASISRLRTPSQEDLKDSGRSDRTLSTRGRTQSKENVLDNNSSNGGRRSRMDQHKADKDTKLNTTARGRLSRADAVDSPAPAKLTKHQRSKSTTSLFAKNTQHLTIQVDEVSIQQFQDELDKMAAKPRRDDRVGPRSRIPMPVDAKRRLQKEGGDTVGATDLKRFDSGVDINNFSPTDNSMQGEDEHSLAWQPQPEAVEVAAYTQPRDTQLDTDDYF